LSENNADYLIYPWSVKSREFIYGSFFML
jgi:hypothetical protein